MPTLAFGAQGTAIDHGGYNSFKVGHSGLGGGGTFGYRPGTDPRWEAGGVFNANPWANPNARNAAGWEQWNARSGMSGGMGGGMYGGGGGNFGTLPGGGTANWDWQSQYGGAGGAGGNGLFAQFQANQEAAKKANEQRYNDILDQRNSLYTRQMGQLDRFSDQETKDINTRFDQRQAQGTQDLISRGLGNTTVTSAISRGINQDREADLRRLGDLTNQRRMTADQGLTEDKLQFMERRTDSYPDQNLLAQLALKSGQGGMSGSGSGSVTGGAPGAAGSYGGAFGATSFGGGTQGTAAIGALARQGSLGQYMGNQAFLAQRANNHQAYQNLLASSPQGQLMAMRKPGETANTPEMLAKAYGGAGLKYNW